MNPQQKIQAALQHQKRNELDRAEPLYREILAELPDQPETLCMLGQLLLHTGRAEEGLVMLQRAVGVRPDPAFYAALGQGLAQAGRLDEAIAAQRKAAELVPSMAALHYNLGTTLKTRGHLDEAATSFRTAIRLQPGLAQAHNNLANVLQAQGKTEEAIASYREGLRLAPDDAVAHNNLGNALKAGGQMEDAEDCYRAALRLKPDFAEAWNNLADLCLVTGRHEESLKHSEHARRLAPGNAVMLGNYQHIILFHPAVDEARVQRELAHWRETLADPLRSQITPHANDRSRDRPLRVGYVSPDFCDHVVGRNMLPLFQNHDRGQFELFCYSGVSAPDRFSARFRDLSAHTISTTGMTDEQLAARIRADRIDILVDLTLHTAGSRLLVFARKPAPVQVTFAGYPGSTGLDLIDYRLTDPLLDPPGRDDSIYAEKSIRIPSFWCYDPVDPAPEVGNVPALTAPGVTFSCLNNFCKINEPTLALWARILSTMPTSRLVLLAGEGPHRGKVIGFMLRRGVAPEQLRFSQKLPRAAYLELYQQVDIGLDPLPYNGHTTTLDALFMGVPVVTLPGKTVAGRAGVSQLTNLGLPELIAQSEDDFVRIATELAHDLPRLASIRAALRGRMQASVLMDAPLFARSIENAYRTMWQKWCSTPA